MDMQRILCRTLTVLVLGLVCSPALAQVYRCIDANGHTTYTQRPCRGGVDTGIPTEGYTTSPQAERDLQRYRQTMQSPAPSPRRQTIPSAPDQDFASQATLAHRCGRLHDGVNATHRPALEHLLQRLLDTGRVIQLSTQERQSIRELQCRVDRLRIAQGLAPLYSR